MTTILTVILVIVIAGTLLHLVHRYVPMDAQWKRLLDWVVVVMILIWLLDRIGLWSYLGIRIHG